MTTYRSLNPSHLDDVVAEVTLATADELVAACSVARQAQGLWAGTPPPVRGKVISAVGRIAESNKEALARLVTREVGKPWTESLGEVQEIIDTCDFFLGEGRRLYGQTVPSELPDKQLFTYRVPVGVTVVITAGNFPVAVPSWYLVPALLCGNVVVWKAAEYSVACAQALRDIFVAAGVPDGVLQLVVTDGATTFGGLGQGLDAGVIDKIGFTGSSAVGRRIAELAGRHLQSPCLELGGKNPMVIAPDADVELAVEGALFSGFGTAGQRCTSLGTVIVHTSRHDEFVELFDRRVCSIPVGDPSRDVVMGPLMSDVFARRFEEYLGWLEPHHRLLGSGGIGRIGPDNPRSGFVGDPDAGLYYHPIIVDGVLPDDRIFREECFGPMVGVATYRDLGEAIELSNAPGYGLTASVYTNDPKTAFRFRSGVGAGMVSINNSTSGAEAHLPFGGNGRSGNGSRQSGTWALDQFTRWQAVNWDYSGQLQRAQMDVGTVEPDFGYRLP